MIKKSEQCFPTTVLENCIVSQNITRGSIRGHGIKTQILKYHEKFQIPLQISWEFSSVIGSTEVTYVH